MGGRPRGTGGRLVALVIVTVGVVFSCGDIDYEEMRCEEAAVRVESCCERIDIGRFNCITDPGGCGGVPREPAFSDKAADCIFDLSCSDMRDRGICDGLRTLHYGPYPNQDRAAFEKEACR